MFVLGCGRSGTTVTGDLLGAHPDVAYLMEPRLLWAIDPLTDARYPGAGRIALGAGDLTPAAADALRAAFEEAVRATGRTRLVEKTPINAFRIGYLDALWPTASFVHVIRDGRAVAASIARAATPPPAPTGLRGVAHRMRHRQAPEWAWYGVEDNKWHLLRALALAQGIEGVGACEEDLLARGILEWRLAVTAARRSLAALDPGRSTELRYEDLLARPRDTVARVLDAVALDRAEPVLALADRQVRDPGRPAPPLTAAARAIGGALLDELGYGTT